MYIYACIYYLKYFVINMFDKYFIIFLNGLCLIISLNCTNCTTSFVKYIISFYYRLERACLSGRNPFVTTKIIETDAFIINNNKNNNNNKQEKLSSWPLLNIFNYKCIP